MIDFLNSIVDFFDMIITAIVTIISGLITMIKAVMLMASFASTVSFLIPTMCLAFIVLGITIKILYKILGR